MKKTKKLLYSFLVIIFFIASLSYLLHKSPVQPAPKNLSDIKSINIAGQNLNLELAITTEQKNKGLSFRSKIEKDYGMLFVFDYPGKYSFWMKDMNFPIDMIWIGEDQRVVFIKQNASPESYPEVYQPGKNDSSAKYILEVYSGFTKDNNLKVGDVVGLVY